MQGRTDQRQLKTFVRDAHRFALSYRWIIEQAPLQAYTSALVFAPACSLVKKTFKAEEPGWISTKPVVEADWNECLQTLEDHSNFVTSVAFSADGQRLASGLSFGFITLASDSDVETIKIWDLASGQCVQTLEGHSNLVHSVIFSLDNLGRHGYRLGKDNTWIICNGRNVLWLPPEYRPNCSAVHGPMVSIGCESGRVFTIGFSRDI